MKILQINGYQSPGRRFNGLSLKPYLQALGVESTHFVWEQDKPEDGVVSFSDPKVRRRNDIARRLEDRFSLQSQLFMNGRRIAELPEFQQADVLHLHIIHSGFFSMQSLPRLTSEKPTFWTLHDPWAMTGHCVHPFSCQGWKTGCGDCPDLETDFRIRTDRTALNFRLKQRAYRRSRLNLIVASRWMEDMVRQSPLLGDFPLHRIPFGLDLESFKGRDQSAAKARLGIEPYQLVICFRSVDNDFKGLKYVLEALERIHSDLPICLLTLNDKGRVEHLKNRFNVVEIGWTNDDDVMRDVYDATDIFLMPSVADSFGLMAIEAMAFGKPTICFEGTALPEVAFAPEAALAVPSRDAEALAAALARLIANPDERRARGARGRELAEQHYDIRLQARRHYDLYRSVIAK